MPATRVILEILIVVSSVKWPGLNGDARTGRPRDESNFAANGARLRLDEYAATETLDLRGYRRRVLDADVVDPDRAFILERILQYTRARFVRIFQDTVTPVRVLDVMIRMLEAQYRLVKAGGSLDVVGP